MFQAAAQEGLKGFTFYHSNLLFNEGEQKARGQGNDLGTGLSRFMATKNLLNVMSQAYPAKCPEFTGRLFVRPLLIGLSVSSALHQSKEGPESLKDRSFRFIRDHQSEASTVILTASAALMIFTTQPVMGSFLLGTVVIDVAIKKGLKGTKAQQVANQIFYPILSLGILLNGDILTKAMVIMDLFQLGIAYYDKQYYEKQYSTEPSFPTADEQNWFPNFETSFVDFKSRHPGSLHTRYEIDERHLKRGIVDYSALSQVAFTELAGILDGIDFSEEELKEVLNDPEFKENCTRGKADRGDVRKYILDGIEKILEGEDPKSGNGKVSIPTLMNYVAFLCQNQRNNNEPLKKSLVKLGVAGWKGSAIFREVLNEEMRDLIAEGYTGDPIDYKLGCLRDQKLKSVINSKCNPLEGEDLDTKTEKNMHKFNQKSSKPMQEMFYFVFVQALAEDLGLWEQTQHMNLFPEFKIGPLYRSFVKKSVRFIQNMTEPSPVEMELTLPEIKSYFSKNSQLARAWYEKNEPNHLNEAFRENGSIEPFALDYLLCKLGIQKLCVD